MRTPIMAFRRPTARSGDCGSQPTSVTAARDGARLRRRHRPPLPRRLSLSLFLRVADDDIPLSENNMVARADHGMIRPGTRSRRGPRMNPTPDSALSDPQQIIADLRRELAECRADRDEALEQQTATTEEGYINHRSYSGPPEIIEFFKSRPINRPGPGTTMDRLVRGESCVHVP